jgi:sulfite dehydrogenase (quinone) subunit SoeC
MHPAGSVIWFTTLSGAGYGLLFLLGLLAGTPLVPDSRWFAFAALALGLGLVAAGLVSSTLHLGHPERAWRAFSQWRSSWLSREGVLSVIGFLPAAVFGIAWVFFGLRLAWAGWLMAAFALATVFSTAMIYASLKPIPHWHNPWVVPNYLLLALMTGSLLMRVVAAFFGQASPALWILSLAAIALAAAGKLAYWRHVSRSAPAATAESATGLGALGRVRLLEAPHTEENYLLKEMGYHIARKHAVRLRVIAIAFAFALPLLLTWISPQLAPPIAAGASLLAAAAGMLGVLVERWLFFAEAKHSVTLYYGASIV